MLIAPQSFKKVVIVENMHFYKNDVCGNNFHIIQLSLIKPKKELDNFQR